MSPDLDGDGPDGNVAAHPYDALTPDLVLSAVESLGFAVDARLYPLNSYENRVYQLGLEDAAPVVVKFYRPHRWSDAQIQEEHDFIRELAALDIPVALPWQAADGQTLHGFAGFRFAVFPRLPGRAPDLEDAEHLEVLGRYLGRIHLAGAVKPFAVRDALAVDHQAVLARDTILAGPFLPDDLRPAYDTLSADLLMRLRQAFANCPCPQQRIHGDCHPGNVLWHDGAPQFVDFDDAVSGPVIQDIWMLLAGNRDQCQGQLRDIVAGYEDFADFPRRQLALVEPLRGLRLMHYAGWLARRWSDPAFPHHFPWFNTPRYWAGHILELREQLAALDEPPLQVI